MAVERRAYPIIAANVWWKVRAQFSKTLPGIVSPNYLATILGSSEKTAKNVLPALRTMGLIDDDSKPTERANRFRFDEDYPAVCKEILEEVYPDELRHAVPDPVQDLSGAERWFKRDAGVGDDAARQMARVFGMVFDADPAKKPETLQSRASPKERKVAETAKPSSSKGAEVKPEQKKVDPPKSDGKTPALPEVHIDVQIHIASDTSLEQIEQIFSSMRKHLYGEAR